MTATFWSEEIMSSRQKYEILLYWSEEDHASFVEVLELSGCMAAGPTYKKALANVEVIIGEWMETAEEQGRPIPEPKGRLLHI